MNIHVWSIQQNVKSEKEMKEAIECFKMKYPEGWLGIGFTNFTNKKAAVEFVSNFPKYLGLKVSDSNIGYMVNMQMTPFNATTGEHNTSATKKIRRLIKGLKQMEVF